MNEYKYDCILALCENEWNALYLVSDGSWQTQTVQTKGRYIEEFCERMNAVEV